LDEYSWLTVVVACRDDHGEPDQAIRSVREPSAARAIGWYCHWA
jgi:hypothetical protein